MVTKSEEIMAIKGIIAKNLEVMNFCRVAMEREKDKKRYAYYQSHYTRINKEIIEWADSFPLKGG